MFYDFIGLIIIHLRHYCEYESAAVRRRIRFWMMSLYDLDNGWRNVPYPLLIKRLIYPNALKNIYIINQIGDITYCISYEFANSTFLFLYN